MQRLALAACALMLLTGTSAARPGVAATTVNLRAEASTSSAIVAKIPGGARIDVGDCTGEWCAVTFQGRNGFAIATALDTTRGATRRVAPRRPLPPPGVDPDDDFEPVAPGYGPPPAYAVAPPPVVYYGPGPYWGRPYWGRPYWGYRRHWRRW